MRDTELETLLKSNGVDSDKISNIMQYYREHNIEVRERSEVWWVESL